MKNVSWNLGMMTVYHCNQNVLICTLSWYILCLNLISQGFFFFHIEELASTDLSLSDSFSHPIFHSSLTIWNFVGAVLIVTMIMEQQRHYWHVPGRSKGLKHPAQSKTIPHNEKLSYLPPAWLPNTPLDIHQGKHLLIIILA